MNRRARLAVFAALSLAAMAPAEAQRTGDGYLFHKPSARISIRGGYAQAMAGSDIFDQVVTDLTLNKRDFNGLTFAGELGFPITSRLDISFDAGVSSSNARSEFRKFVDNKKLPIEQTTTFMRVPLTANLRYYLKETGRSIGKLAWIPSHIVPWVGAGGGATWYRFRQEGDFIDFATTNVFADELASAAWAPTVQGMAGVDVSLSPSFAITGDARYLWAKGTLERDFRGFDRIDLSGVSVTLGITYRM